ncbi:MAG: TolC family protein [Planctomycetota bacterium]
MHRTLHLRPRATLLAALCGLTWLSCRSPEAFVAEADGQVYDLLHARLEALKSGDLDFDIAPPTDSLRAKIVAGETTTVGPLTLVECLEIAAEDSERYRTEREALFLEALNLTLDRWRFGWQPTLDGGGALSGTGGQSSSASIDSNLRLQRLFGSGARVIGDIGASLFRVLSTGDAFDLVSDLGLSVTQPLLRGFGSAITLEPLTQAERDLVYRARSYERFRRTFSVDVATQVYGLLEAYDNLANEERNFNNLVVLRKRNEALAEAGQMSDIQADQARQDELRSQSRLVALRGDLERRLDTFKLFLGLPISCELSLDRGEFDRLTDEASLLDSLEGFNTERVVDFACAERLDVATSAQAVEDAERAVRIAADDLRAGLDLRAGVNSTSPDGKPLSHHSDDVRWSLALDVDLPIDRLPERNAYRSSLVRFEAERRGHERFLDRVSTDVRDAIRQARNARASYQIQVRAVQLADRRVRSANLNLEAGRASTRDALEAQSSLLEAQNAQTAALIDFNLAMFDLYLQLEVLRVDGDGIHVDADLVQRLLANG